jgi:hypothetical protein
MFVAMNLHVNRSGAVAPRNVAPTGLKCIGQHDIYKHIVPNGTLHACSQITVASQILCCSITIILNSSIPTPTKSESSLCVLCDFARDLFLAKTQRAQRSAKGNPRSVITFISNCFPFAFFVPIDREEIFLKEPVGRSRFGGIVLSYHSKKL